MKSSFLTKLLICILFVFIIAVLAAGIMKTNCSTVYALFQNREFLDAVWFSLKTSITATFLSFVIGVPSGFYLARNRGFISGLLDAVFDIPLIVPPLVVGVFLLMFFNVPVINQLYPFIFTTAGAVTAQFFVAVPLTIKSAKNAFELVPPVYEMVAMTLGSRPYKSFYDTTFKIAFPGILSGLILTWLRCMGEFGATLMVGGGIPFKTENIPINIYLNMTSGDFKAGIAASVVSIIIAFICILFVKSIFNLKMRKKYNGR
jgi:molybdate transport system permease protein